MPVSMRRLCICFAWEITVLWPMYVGGLLCVKGFSYVADYFIGRLHWQVRAICIILFAAFVPLSRCAYICGAGKFLKNRYYMKKCFFLVLATFLLVGCGGPVFRNPLGVKFGDPFVLRASDGKFYMYGTGGVANGFRACVSEDLVNWSEAGVVYNGDSSKWAKDCFWAPEVYERDGRFYMFFSANWRENPQGDDEVFRIGVAVADSPLGPFRDLYDRPVFDPGYPIIDANVLWDDDGRVYLYYSRCCYKHPVESELSEWARNEGLFSEIEESWVYGVEMKPDFSGVIGEPVALLAPPASVSDPQAAWESRSVTSGEVNRRWTEGSFAFKKNGTYYMMYSANFYGGKHYAVGYATAGSPLGPFVKSAANPVLEKNVDKGGEVTGTGHCMMLEVPGKGMFCVYHGRTALTGDERVVFIDRMNITPDGALKVNGPTTTPQSLPLD